MGKIIAWIMGKIGSKVVLTGFQFAGAIAFIIAHAIVLGFIVYTVKFFYDQYNIFMSFVVNLQGTTELTGLMMSFLSAIGFLNAFNDVFAIFSPFLSAFLIYKLATISFSISRAISNELFKIGVIWQQ
ncbi:MAG: hypothetical protein COA39_011860 [Sulfurimonas sp.]|nr:hypothetical protein [Sulfurimonas sp.]